MYLDYRCKNTFFFQNKQKKTILLTWQIKNPIHAVLDFTYDGFIDGIWLLWSKSILFLVTYCKSDKILAIFLSYLMKFSRYFCRI